MKINITRRLFSSSAALLAVTFSSGTFAYAAVVFDPTNFIKNAITAQQAIVAEINAIKQIQQLAKSNSANFKGVDSMTAQQQNERIQQLSGSATRLSNSIGNSQQVVTQMQSIYGAGNYSNWTEFSAVLAKSKAAGDASTTNLINSAEVANQQIIDSSVSHRQIVDSLGGVAGVTEATQATTSAVGVLITQNQSMLGLLAASNKEAGRKAQMENIQQQNVQNDIKAYSDSTNQRYQQLKNQWGN